MFDRLDDILIHYEEIMQELGEPNVTENQDRFRKLMKEQADLAPLVEAYKAYKQAKQDIEDSLALLEEESDEEMRELAKRGAFRCQEARGGAGAGTEDPVAAERPER